MAATEISKAKDMFAGAFFDSFSFLSSQIIMILVKGSRPYI